MVKERTDKSAQWVQKRDAMHERHSKDRTAFYERIAKEESELDAIHPTIEIGELTIIATAEGHCWIKPFPAQYSFSRDDALLLRDWLTETFN